jgi:hypothetical protein
VNSNSSCLKKEKEKRKKKKVRRFDIETTVK